MRMTRHIFKLIRPSLLSLVLLEVSLVDGIFYLKLPLLFDLIVVDNETFTLKSHTIQIEFGICSIIWLFEADKCKVAFQTFVEFDALNFTMLLEQVFDVILGPLIWEIFDKEIASLL